MAEKESKVMTTDQGVKRKKLGQVDIEINLTDSNEFLIFVKGVRDHKKPESGSFSVILLIDRATLMVMDSRKNQLGNIDSVYRVLRYGRNRGYVFADYLFNKKDVSLIRANNVSSDVLEAITGKLFEDQLIEKPEKDDSFDDYDNREDYDLEDEE